MDTDTDTDFEDDGGFQDDAESAFEDANFGEDDGDFDASGLEDPEDNSSSIEALEEVEDTDSPDEDVPSKDTVKIDMFVDGEEGSNSTDLLGKLGDPVVQPSTEVVQPTVDTTSDIESNNIEDSNSGSESDDSLPSTEPTVTKPIPNISDIPEQQTVDVPELVSELIPVDRVVIPEKEVTPFEKAMDANLKETQREEALKDIDSYILKNLTKEETLLLSKMEMCFGDCAPDDLVGKLLHDYMKTCAFVSVLARNNGNASQAVPIIAPVVGSTPGGSTDLTPVLQSLNSLTELVRSVKAGQTDSDGMFASNMSSVTDDVTPVSSLANLEGELAPIIAKFKSVIEKQTKLYHTSLSSVQNNVSSLNEEVAALIKVHKHLQGDLKSGSSTSNKALIKQSVSTGAFGVLLPSFVFSISFLVLGLLIGGFSKPTVEQPSSSNLDVQKEIISSLPDDYKLIYYIEKLRERGFTINVLDNEGKISLEIYPSQDAKIKKSGRSLHFEVNK